jgi:hypothetical protein
LLVIPPHHRSFVDQVQVFKDHGIPSFFGDMSSPYEVPDGASNIFLREMQCEPASYPVCHLGPHWEAAIELLAKRDIKPGLANGTLVGVFLGDERESLRFVLLQSLDL